MLNKTRVFRLKCNHCNVLAHFCVLTLVSFQRNTCDKGHYCVCLLYIATMQYVGVVNFVFDMKIQKKNVFKIGILKN